MILHIGERVYWGAPEVIYLEGTIVTLDEQTQTAIVHVDRATAHSSHLIGTDLPFAANGVMPLQGESPSGTTTTRSEVALPPPEMSNEEKIRSAAAVAVHQQYGYNLPSEQEQNLINQVAQILEQDPTVRNHILTSMDEILKREW